MFCGNAGLDFSDRLQQMTREGGAHTFEAGAELNILFRKIEIDPSVVSKIDPGEPWAHFFRAAAAFENASKDADEIPITALFTTPKVRRDVVTAVLQPELEDHLLEATSSRQIRRYLSTPTGGASDLEIVLRILLGQSGLDLKSLGDIYRNFAAQLKETGNKVQEFVAMLRNGTLSGDNGRRLLADWERITQTGRFIGTLLERR